MTNEVDQIDLALGEDGLASFCFVLYKCSFCGVRTYLSMSLDSIRSVPFEVKFGAIVTRCDKQTKDLIRKNVICLPCIKDMRYQNNKDKEDVQFSYFGADDPKAEVEETINQLKRQAGILY